MTDCWLARMSDGEPTIPVNVLGHGFAVVGKQNGAPVPVRVTFVVKILPSGSEKLNACPPEVVAKASL